MTRSFCTPTCSAGREHRCHDWARFHEAGLNPKDHRHGEIDLVMPLEGPVDVDGQGAGWKVYNPGSAHDRARRARPVLYLLPEGAIQFTGEQRGPER